MSLIASTSSFVGSLIWCMVTTALLLPILRRKAIFDHPNARASHTTPTPRGGGIAVVSAVVFSWVAVEVLNDTLSTHVILLAGSAMGLAIISWLDDLTDLSAVTRLAVHTVGVLIGINALPDGSLIFQGYLPDTIDYFTTVLLWIWFINLFNFMDGIDGISGTETASIGLGIFVLAAIGLVAPQWGFLGLICAGAAVGFLFFNWHPAKIFLGDVGSVPLGFLLGWLLLSLAAQGLWAPAVILPLYYLADASLTLGRRALRGEKIWHAHKTHFYQKAHQAGNTHAAVVKRILAVNIVLIGCAVLAARGDVVIGLAVAFASVAALLWHFAASHRKATS